MSGLEQPKDDDEKGESFRIKPDENGAGQTKEVGSSGSGGGGNVGITTPRASSRL